MTDRLTKILSEQKTYSGLLTTGAKKRLTKAIEQLVMVSKSERLPLNFITLTIAETDRNLTGKEATGMLLEPFLQWLRRIHNIRCYVWKAELQQRGQIHYHITSAGYIPKEQLREEWHRLQRKNGLLDGFHKKYGHWSPPGTEIEGVKCTHDLVGYLKKKVMAESKCRDWMSRATARKKGTVVSEMNKALQNENSLYGKVWDCSQNLKAANYFTVMADSKYFDRINALVDQGIMTVKALDQCTIYEMVKEQPKNILKGADYDEYHKLMKAIARRDLVTIKKVKPEKFVSDIKPAASATNSKIYSLYKHAVKTIAIAYLRDVIDKDVGTMFDIYVEKQPGLVPVPDVFSTS